MKTAVVISGMLRNYDAALLSLHIWDADNVVKNDRYLVTWKSAGDDVIDDYCNKANIKQAFVVDDAEMLTQKYQHNPFRMLYLWREIARQVPKDYDKYIIVRPDGFYWTFDVEKLREVVRNASPFKTNSWIDRSIVVDEDKLGLGDHILIVDKTHLAILESAFDEITKIAEKRYTSGNDDNIHTMLHDYYVKQLGIDPYCNVLVETVECIFQRDTFKTLSHLDKYDYETYKSVYYDTASWWRRTNGGNYGGLPRVKY